MIKSIYNQDSNTSVKILSSTSKPPFIIQKEEIAMHGDVTVLDVVYTETGFYVGDLDQMNWLIESGITEQIEPRSGDINCTCSIGFNPTEQKYYGWSHRASYGFGIGSKVERGDCAYKAKAIEDFNQYLLDFWNIDDGIWRECESPDITCTTVLISMESNIIDPDEEAIYQIASVMDPIPIKNLKFGTLLVYKVIFKGADRDFIHNNFTQYPDQWGFGEWEAKTLEDAKEMAKDFAEGVS